MNVLHFAIFVHQALLLAFPGASHQNNMLFEAFVEWLLATEYPSSTGYFFDTAFHRLLSFDVCVFNPGWYSGEQMADRPSYPCLLSAGPCPVYQLLF